MAKSFTKEELPAPDSLIADYDYEVVILENGLKALLLSSPKVDMACCAMAVGVGSAADPDNFSGLAHFCEHMLFMGTKRYPDENEYEAFVKNNGGEQNAFTCLGTTTYYACIKPDQLESLVDRTTDFFIDPIFKKDGVGREVDAIQSEYEKSIGNDEVSRFFLARFQSSAKHPRARFSCGNHSTLKKPDQYKGNLEKAFEDLRNALLKFHDTWYSSEYMSVVIVGSHSVAEMKAMAVPRLSKIPKKEGLKIPQGQAWAQGAPLIESSNLKTMCKFAPLKEDDKLISFTFYTKDLHDLWRTKPDGYVGHLLGHESEGSILTALKKLGLGYGIMAGCVDSNSGGSVFQVKVQCTEKGMTNSGIKEIGDVLFAYTRFMVLEGVQKRFWNEHNMVEEISWKHSGIPGGPGLALAFVDSLLFCDPQLVFKANSVALEYNEEDISNLVKDINPDNMTIILTSSDYKDIRNTTAPYYDIKYWKGPIEKDWMKSWLKISKETDKAKLNLEKYGLHFPIPNKFIPSRLDILKIEKRSEYPYQLDWIQGTTVHFLQDTVYKLPHAIIAVDFFPPTVTFDVVGYPSFLQNQEAIIADTFENCDRLTRRTLFNIYINYVEETLRDKIYQAELGGLGVRLATDNFKIVTSGFDDKQAEMLKTVLEKLHDCGEFSSDTLDLILEKMRTAVKGKILTQPAYMYAMGLESIVVGAERFQSELILERLEKLTTKKVISLLNKDKAKAIMFQDSQMSMLAMGNLVESTFRSKILGMEIWNKLTPRSSPVAPLVGNRPVSTLNLKKYSDACNKPDDNTLTPLDTAVSKNTDWESRRSGYILHQRNKNIEDPNGCTLLTIQAGITDARTSALLQALSIWLEEKFFTDLRTKQQLGYVTKFMVRSRGGLGKAQFLVQSTLPSLEVLKKIEIFIMELVYQTEENYSQGKVSPQLDQAGFEQVKTGAIAALEEKPKNLSALHEVYAAETFWRRYEFNRKQKGVEELKK